MATRSDANQSFFVYVADKNTGVVQRIAIPSDVQIGLEGKPAELQLFGRLSLSAININIDAVNKGIVIITNDNTVVAINLVVTPVSGIITVNLPSSPRDGQVHFFKDMTGTANVVPINIVPQTGVMIDGFESKTLTDSYGSLALIYMNGQWRLLVAGLGSSGGSGAPTDAEYVLMNAAPSLPDARTAAASSNITVTDGGPGGNVSFNLSEILGGEAGTYTYTTVTADEYGRITGIASGVPPIPPEISASYLTAVLELGLPDARYLTGIEGINTVDFGAGSTFQVGINNNIIATISGSTFTGAVIAAGSGPGTGFSGSLQLLSDGKTPYLVGFGSIAVTTSSNGQVVISGSQLATVIAGAGGTSVSEIAGDYTISSSVYADKFGSYVLIGTDAEIPDARIITASGGTSITDGGAGGHLTVSSSVGADKYASYVSVAFDPNNPSSRALLAGTNITFTDGGPGGTFTIAAPGGGSGGGGTGGWTDTGDGLYTTSSVSIDSQGRLASSIGTNVEFFVSGTIGLGASTNEAHVSVFGGDVTVSGTLTAQGGLTGSLTRLYDGLVYLVGAGTVGITTNSLGQVIISGSASGSIPFNSTGSGGTSVSLSGYLYTISSSVYADTYGPFALISSSVKEPSARVLAAGNGISLLDNGPGSTLVITNTDAGSGGSDPWTDTGAGLYTTSSVSIDPLAHTATDIGTNVFFYVSGTVGLAASTKEAHVSVFGGDVTVSGTLTAFQGFSGSLTQLSSGIPYIIGVGSVTVTTNSLGQVILSGTGGASGFTSATGSGGTSVSNDGLGNYTISSSVGAAKYSSYVVIGLDADNPNERKLTAGSGISITDDGPDNNVLISTTASSGTIYADLYGSYAVVTADAELPNAFVVTGQGGITVSHSTGFLFISSSVITVAGTGGTAVTDGGGTAFTVSSSVGADLFASYVVMGIDAVNQNERKLTGSVGIIVTDGGTGGNATVGINNNVIATVSGTTFTGPVVASGGLSGSLQLLSNGTMPYIVGQGLINVYTSSSGQVVVSASISSITNILGAGGSTVTQLGTVFTVSSSIGADPGASYVLFATDAGLPNSLVATGQGSVTVAKAGGLLNISSSLVTVVGVGGTTVADGGGTTYTVSSSIGASPSSSYVVIGLDAENPNERQLVARGDIKLTDNGPQSSVVLLVTGTWSDAGNALFTSGTVSIDSQGRTASVIGTDTFFFVSGTIGLGSAGREVNVFGGDTVASGSITALGAGGFTGSLTSVAPGDPFLVAGPFIAVAANSLGQWTIAVTGSASGADANASYIVVSTTSSLASDRALVGRGAVRTIDNGVGQSFVLLVTGTLQDSGTGLLYTTSSIQSTGGFSGSLTQLANGSGAYIVGTGAVTVTTNSLGQLIINSPMAVSSQVAYQGYVTSSVWWNATAWTPFLQACPDSAVNDIIASNIIRTGTNGSDFLFLSGGLFNFHANFNAYGSDAYISLRLNGVSSSKGVVLERTTYRTNPMDQNEIQLDGIFSASAGDNWTLEYVTSGTTFPWVTQDPLPGGAAMNTGEISIFPIPLTQNTIFSGGSTSATAPTYAEIIFIAGDQTTQSNTSFFTAGARSFDTTQYPLAIGATNRFVKFIATLQNTAGAAYTNIQLYDVRNSVVITGTTLSNSSSVSQVLPYDVESIALTLGTLSGNLRTDSSGMYEVQVEMISGSIVADASTCSNARLIVYYA